MTEEELKKRIEAMSPQTTAHVKDFTGSGDHYQATVISLIFEGKSTIERHKMVMEIFKAEMETNEVHALSLKTYTPEQFNKLNLNNFND